jgi:hypothetical protein
LSLINALSCLYHFAIKEVIFINNSNLKENTPSSLWDATPFKKGELKKNLYKLSLKSLKFPFFKRGGCEADGVSEGIYYITFPIANWY